MADALEKKLGDLLSELEARRNELRTELDRVNAQLDLLAKLVASSSSSSKKILSTTASPRDLKTRVRDSKIEEATKATPTKADSPTKGSNQRKRKSVDARRAPKQLPKDPHHPLQTAKTKRH